MRRAALLSILGSLVLCGPASSQPSVGTLFIRGSMGFATQALDDWNDDIDLINEGVPGSSGPKDLDNFGGVVPWGVEVGYQLKRSFAISVGVLRQRDLLENSYTIPLVDALTLNSELAMTAVTGAVSYWPPGGRGFFIGADMGMGFGTARRDFSQSVRETGDWSGSGLVGGGFLGYEHQSRSGLLLNGKVGYQLQNLGEFDGVYVTSAFPSPPGGTTVNGPPLDLYGRPMETDFSGFQFLLGIGYAFGGK